MKVYLYLHFPFRVKLVTQKARGFSFLISALLASYLPHNHQIFY